MEIHAVSLLPSAGGYGADSEMAALYSNSDADRNAKPLTDCNAAIVFGVDSYDNPSTTVISTVIPTPPYDNSFFATTTLPYPSATMGYDIFGGGGDSAFSQNYSKLLLNNGLESSQPADNDASGLLSFYSAVGVADAPPTDAFETAPASNGASPGSNCLDAYRKPTRKYTVKSSNSKANRKRKAAATVSKSSTVNDNVLSYYHIPNEATVATTTVTDSATVAMAIDPPFVASPSICRLCDTPIVEECVLLCVDDRAFHAACLKCGACDAPLADASTCFVKFGALYCKPCYVQKFQNKCTSCDRRIHATDWVRRAGDSLYHLACFACDHCKRQLSTGEQFSLLDDRLLCKQHYLELVQGEDSNVKQKAKRVRTTFAEEQLSILQAHFHIDCNPDGSDLERIANLTGLSKRVTQVWFQNSRARQKKHQVGKKPSDDGSAGTVGPTVDSSSDRSSSAFTAASVEGAAPSMLAVSPSAAVDPEGSMLFPRSTTASSDSNASICDDGGVGNVSLAG